MLRCDRFLDRVSCLLADRCDTCRGVQKQTCKIRPGETIPLPLNGLTLTTTLMLPPPAGAMAGVVCGVNRTCVAKGLAGCPGVWNIRCPARLVGCDGEAGFSTARAPPRRDGDGSGSPHIVVVVSRRFLFQLLGQYREMGGYLKTKEQPGLGAGGRAEPLSTRASRAGTSANRVVFAELLPRTPRASFNVLVRASKLNACR